MKHYDKLIFVSESDTSTSPMAEAILQQEFLLEDILITSKGLVVLFPEPINPKAEAVLVSHSLSMKDHVSEQLTEDDFDDRTLILTMDTHQMERLLKDQENARNVFTLASYIQADEDIEDPYGGSLADYNRTYETLKVYVLRLSKILSMEETRLQQDSMREDI
ncbi:MAG: phosphotyrosine protein phosphatase [Lachnospiraceae bacterium]|nr:phosphotyrosine protein phosphatase [Lachnospiraceae bacterium]